MITLTSIASCKSHKNCRSLSGNGMIGSFESMKACFPVLGARNRADFSAYRTHHSLVSLTKPRPAWGRSVEQFEQLVGEQSDHAKHQVQPDFLGSPHYDVAAPKLFCKRLY